MKHHLQFKCKLKFLQKLLPSSLPNRAVALHQAAVHPHHHQAVVHQVEAYRVAKQYNKIGLIFDHDLFIYKTS